ncbi:hypothetical protein [Gordonia alkanivorans]|jgi:hypothetical protein|uniref:Uncharacterized protein n=1 Tax=Gordonia alkanivorans NBRC 16433 TaxID=1027371 RepID=F9VPM5_9ACTN|nr:hypothetical protein [Gordonia alkanivorans]MDH3008425.1 hypothetical protein [Gordonia alkanivorans]MDH3026661.1 hypothetical protein [Gordonia alkanivorans]MDH3044622.1 hypothetical protein [Gordonia alkanivorans]MDH3048993.1 hypothetical protein [Gordonia alkanivorans]MDJ0006404.1 hypothetical protein [Gordonia alkanivorans]
MFLSPADEYFTHQTALTHAMVATSDPSWRERYWVSFQDTESGDTVLTLGLGRYPNQDVMEAFACFSSGERQTNLRLSRTLLPDSHGMTVGPLSCEIVEPLAQLRFTLDDNDSGLRFDITFEATFEPMLEGRFFQISRARATYDAIRYVQHGRARGWIVTPDGRRIEVTPDRWWAERDHSWGTRPLPRAEGQPPGERPEWKMLMFAPLQLPDLAVHMYLQESRPGEPVHLSASAIRPPGDNRELPPIVAVDHDLKWAEDAAAPTLLGGRVVLTLLGGETTELEITACKGRAHLRGGGYEGWNGWRQGQWRGELTAEHDEWDLTDRDNFYRYAKAGSDHLVEVRHGDDVGYGVIEYMVLPGYGRYEEALPPPRASRSDSR